MSIEWRIVIMIGSLFLLGPNLIYLYILCYYFLIEDEEVKVRMNYEVKILMNDV